MSARKLGGTVGSTPEPIRPELNTLERRDGETAKMRGLVHEPEPGTLAPIEWKGHPTDPGQIPTAGQTAAVYLDSKSFERRSHAQLLADFAGLVSSWPKDTPPGITPAAFDEKAKSIDAYKASMLSNLVNAPSELRAKQLIADLNALHGKAGHTENVVGFVYALLARPEVTAAIGLSDASVRRGAAETLVGAATWLNLCDAQVPTGILCAPRRLSDEEQALYVKPRPEMSAALLGKLGLAKAEVVELVKTHRGGGDRPLLAQFLDLTDQAAAMAAKPFFQKDGKVDAQKLVGALSGNAQKAGLSPDLLQAVASGLMDGLGDSALAKAREKDLWVSP